MYLPNIGKLVIRLLYMLWSQRHWVIQNLSQLQYLPKVGNSPVHLDPGSTSPGIAESMHLEEVDLEHSAT